MPIYTGTNEHNGKEIDGVAFMSPNGLFWGNSPIDEAEEASLTYQTKRPQTRAQRRYEERLLRKYGKN